MILYQKDKVREEMRKQFREYYIDENAAAQDGQNVNQGHARSNSALQRNYGGG
jgi:hypothetical protein